MRLDVQLMIYVYMGICLSLLIFNVFYILVDSSRSRRMKNPGSHLKKLRARVEEYSATGQMPEEWHADNRRNLSHISRLERFHWSMEKLLEEMPEQASTYLAACERDFRYLAPIYQGREELEQAYFAKLLELYGMGRGKEYDELKQVLTEMACSSSIYTRENALQTLYKTGSTEAVCQAFFKMSSRDVFHYGKLLTEGLLRFQGDKILLAAELWRSREELKNEYVLAVMQFIRMSQEGYEEEFLWILKDKAADQEIRLEAVRYFRRYRYEPAYPVLLEIMYSSESIGWEYLAMTALSLENYPGDETVEALKSALTSYNWYVRYNAADTLVRAFQLKRSDLSDVLNGKDKYARDILNYMLQRSERGGEGE